MVDTRRTHRDEEDVGELDVELLVDQLLEGGVLLDDEDGARARLPADVRVEERGALHVDSAVRVVRDRLRRRPTVDELAVGRRIAQVAEHDALGGRQLHRRADDTEGHTTCSGRRVHSRRRQMLVTARSHVRWWTYSCLCA